jgi:predicted DsbA family dithiol-disulfide isomerase
MTAKKMNIEIWSDVTCTHCYSAKRMFESALSQFEHRDKIEVVWKSFELAPQLITDNSKTLPHFLAELQGLSLEQATLMTDHVTETVKEVGLVYDLAKTIPANSFNAHRLSHLAKDQHLQNETEERLFKAYFTEGKNIDDIGTLIHLAEEVGLSISEAAAMLASDKYANEVRHDIFEAKELGITSVPCYVFNRSARVSGAQGSKIFSKTLEESFDAWTAENKSAIADNSGHGSCVIGGDCI